MSESADDFAGLVARARQDDEAALTELVRRYEFEIRLIAHARLGPALRRYLDSIDLAQSVHLVLLRGLREDKFDLSSPEKLIGLAVRLVRWKLARHLRRLYRRQQILNLMIESGDRPKELAPEAITDDPTLAAQLNDEVQQLIKDLGPTERQLVELRLQGYSTAEAARELGLDADVLRVRLSRLRKRLRDRGGALLDWL